MDLRNVSFGIPQKICSIWQS